MCTRGALHAEIVCAAQNFMLRARRGTLRAELPREIERTYSCGPSAVLDLDLFGPSETNSPLSDFDRPKRQEPSASQGADDDKPQMPLAVAASRRDAVVAAATVIGALFGGIGAAPVMANLWKRLSADTRGPVREAASHFLFRNSDRHFYAASKDNPYSQIRGITPATADALSSTLAILGTGREDMRAVDILCTPQLDGTAIFFGGPVANVHSRQILGIGKGSPLLSEAEGKRVMLPFHFGNVLVPNAAPGHRPDYQIFSGETQHTLGPDDDFLLVTSLPNVFSPGYGDVADDRLMIFAGLHGQGSRAIGLLLSQPRLLEEIEKEARSFAGWQVLFRVRRGPGDWPIAIEKISTPRQIKANFDRTRHMVRDKCYWLDPNDELNQV